MGKAHPRFSKIKGYTQEGLAKDIGVSVSVLGEIERGSRLPSDHILVQISELLNVSVEELTPPDELGDEN